MTNPHDVARRIRDLTADLTLLLPLLVALARDLDRLAPRDGAAATATIGEAADAVMRAMKRH